MCLVLSRYCISRYLFIIVLICNKQAIEWLRLGRASVSNTRCRYNVFYHIHTIIINMKWLIRQLGRKLENESVKSKGIMLEEKESIHNNTTDITTYINILSLSYVFFIRSNVHESQLYSEEDNICSPNAPAGTNNKSDWCPVSPYALNNIALIGYTLRGIASKNW